MPTARTTIEISILGRATYNVSIGASLASVRTDALAHVRGGRLIVTDSNVAAHHLEAAMHDCNASGSVVIPAGEQHKTPQTLVDVVRKAADAGLDRGGAIVALGGGVVGDIAGLAAAVFMRGIDFINLPTSLLAMVDAAIGGKTGVDLPEGKNLLGAFHQPRAVVCDMALLASLP
ncbi:MAG: 3-dehydroquinate synthase, partial [Planctomycetota bacterium]